MPKKLSTEDINCIKELYKNDYTPQGIKLLLKQEKKLDISYQTIHYHLNDKVRIGHIERMKSYNRKNNTTVRRRINNNAPELIFGVFDTNQLSATQLRNRIEKKLDVNLPCEFEDKIDRTVKDLEKKLGTNSPIIRVKQYEYKLNHNSPYRVMCDELALQEKVNALS